MTLADAGRIVAIVCTVLLLVAVIPTVLGKVPVMVFHVFAVIVTGISALTSALTGGGQAALCAFSFGCFVVALAARLLSVRLRSRR